jgi:hypothetical protein
MVAMETFSKHTHTLLLFLHIALTLDPERSKRTDAMSKGKILLNAVQMMLLYIFALGLIYFSYSYHTLCLSVCCLLTLAISQTIYDDSKY